MLFRFAILVIASTIPSQAQEWSGQCVEDDGSRLLDNLTKLSDNTPSACIKLCRSKGFKYAGVQYTDECFCGNKAPPSDRIRPETDCGIKCPGDSSKICGGTWRMNVYASDCNGGDSCCINGHCHEGEGDCDSSSDCYGDLVCGQDNCRTGWSGDRSSFDATDDCCMSDEENVTTDLTETYPDTTSEPVLVSIEATESRDTVTAVGQTNETTISVETTTESIEDGVTTNSGVCRDKYSLWKERCYYISEDSAITWIEARDECISLGSKLSSITSQEEQDWIVSEAPSSWAELYIGGTDATSEGNWTWLDGQPWNFTNWDTDAGEPNNDNGQEEENCNEVRSHNELWNDISCEWNGIAVYVCSYDPYE